MVPRLACMHVMEPIPRGGDRIRWDELCSSFLCCVYLRRLSHPLCSALISGLLLRQGSVLVSGRNSGEGEGRGEVYDVDKSAPPVIVAGTRTIGLDRLGRRFDNPGPALCRCRESPGWDGMNQRNPFVVACRSKLATRGHLEPVSFSFHLLT